MLDAIGIKGNRLSAMKIRNTITATLISFLLICFHQPVNACSMYKITDAGRTMVGCNEDAWRTTSSIWFENAKVENEYGACFTGSRQVGDNQFAPQSGMNQEGLVFSRLTAYHPNKNLNQNDKKQITDEVEYLTNILHKCKTIKEVKQYIEMYDHSIFIDDVFMYIDKSGDYLVVEPYKLIEGKKPSYVLANFCPSVTSNQKARNQTRYKNGEDYLKDNELETSLDFCRSMSDTMSVCRSRNGDGTLLTSIWDTQKGLVNLYFYHSYDSTVQFNLDKELALGDHIFSIPTLFAESPEYEQFIGYITPFNVNALRVSLVITGGILFLLAFLYLISYFRKRNAENFNSIKLVFSGLNILLVAYLFVLSTNMYIYYFDAPYQNHSSTLISLSSYIPFLLVVVIIPILFYTFQYIKVNSAHAFVKSALILNNLIYLILIIGFGYWGLFDVLG